MGEEAAFQGSAANYSSIYNLTGSLRLTSSSRRVSCSVHSLVEVAVLPCRELKPRYHNRQKQRHLLLGYYYRPFRLFSIVKAKLSLAQEKQNHNMKCASQVYE